jgi:hypothetical protein
MRVDDDSWSVQNFRIRLQKRGKDSNEGIKEQGHRSALKRLVSLYKRDKAVYGLRKTSFFTQNADGV